MKRTPLFTRLCRTVLLSSGVVLAAGCGGAADQPDGNTSQASAPATEDSTMARGPEISVTGCLTANLEGSSYALTPTPETAAGSAPAAAATPTTPTAQTFTYELVGDVEDFRRHANTVVTARGREDASMRREGDMERTDEAEQQPAAGTSQTPTVETKEEVDVNVRRLAVTTVVATGTTCPSIGGQPNPSTLPQTPR